MNPVLISFYELSCDTLTHPLRANWRPTSSAVGSSEVLIGFAQREAQRSGHMVRPPSFMKGQHWRNSEFRARVFAHSNRMRSELMNLRAPAVRRRTVSADILPSDPIINLNLQVSVRGHIPGKKYCKYMEFLRSARAPDATSAASFWEDVWMLNSACSWADV